MKQIQQIKLFISCPNDIKDEIDSIRFIVEEINKTVGEQNSYTIDCLNWTIDTYTQVGEDPQAVINDQVEGEYDILVGLLWQKIGTPTKRDKSGTIEEINRAIADPIKEKLIYFKTTSPENLNQIDLDELGKINIFKKDLSGKGVLYKEFNSIKEFESLFRINVMNLISDKLLFKSDPKAMVTTHKLTTEKYQPISDLIREVEIKSENIEVDLNVFEFVEKLLSSLEIVGSSMQSMTNTTNHLTAKLDERTDEINKYLAIKDDRLRMAKGKIVVNLLADELDEYNNRTNNELKTFSENFQSIGPTYSKIMQFATTHDLPNTAILRTSVVEFRDSIERLTENTANVLRHVLKWPVLTPKFGKSKRETELALKNITKELLEGLKLLDEAIQ